MALRDWAGRYLLNSATLESVIEYIESPLPPRWSPLNPLHAFFDAAKTFAHAERVQRIWRDGNALRAAALS